MPKRDYLIVVDSDLNEDGKETFGCWVPGLPGCFSAADSLEELDKMATEAIESHIGAMLEVGMYIPENNVNIDLNDIDLRTTTLRVISVEYDED